MIMNLNFLKKISGKLLSLQRKIYHKYFSIVYKKKVLKIIEGCNNLNINTSTIYDLWINYLCLKRVINNNIEGEIVECGIWKGISLVFFSKILEFYKIQKKIFGYDTFEGFPKPGQNDIAKDGSLMRSRFEKSKINEDSSNWNHCSIAEVKRNIERNTINSENVFLIKGKVENTLKEEKNIPKKISILKLDTCLYESTKLELEVLFPRIQKGGVLIVDNYVNYKGVQLAVKEYFTNTNFKLKNDHVSGQIIVNV